MKLWCFVSYASRENGVTDSSFSLNGYYTPEGLPSISVGYETVKVLSLQIE